MQETRMRFLENFIMHKEFSRIGLKSVVCCITLYNGFEVIGSSAPADVRQFSLELGKRFAYDNALEQMDKFIAYAQQDRHHLNKTTTEAANEYEGTDNK